MKTATSRRVYYDFADMLRTNPTGNVPYTPILVRGQDESCMQRRAAGGGLMAAVPSLCLPASLRAWG